MRLTHPLYSSSRDRLSACSIWGADAWEAGAWRLMPASLATTAAAVLAGVLQAVEAWEDRRVMVVPWLAAEARDIGTPEEDRDAK